MVFGRVESGLEIVDQMERIQVDSNDKPRRDIRITKSGLLKAKETNEDKKVDNLEESKENEV